MIIHFFTGKGRGIRMRMTYKKNLFLIVLFVIIISLAACTNKQSDTNSNEIGAANINKTNVPIEIEESNNSNFDIEQIKKAIITAINDDIWYNGDFSTYKGFEGQEALSEIYKKNRSYSNTILVLFDEPFDLYELGKKTGNKGYFGLGFNEIGNGIRDYTNGVAISCDRNTKDEVKKEIIRDEDVFITKTSIKFPNATQPEFPPMDSRREKIIKNIEDKLPKDIEEMCGGEEGLYKAYICNFRDTDPTINVIIENEDGRHWKILYVIDADGNVLLGRSYFEDTIDSCMYLANQIKKVSFERKIMIGKANSDDAMSELIDIVNYKTYYQLPSSNFKLGKYGVNSKSFFYGIPGFADDNKHYIIDTKETAEKSELFVNKNAGYAFYNDFLIVSLAKTKPEYEIIDSFYVCLFKVEKDYIELIDVLKSNHYLETVFGADKLVQLNDKDYDNRPEFEINFENKAQIYIEIAEDKLKVDSNKSLYTMDNIDKNIFGKLDNINEQLHDETLELKQIRVPNFSETNKMGWPVFSLTDYASERNLIRKFFEKEIKEIKDGKYGEIRDVNIYIYLKDINNDGVSEIIAALQHPYFSGYKSNSLVKVFTYSNGKVDKAFDLARANIFFNDKGEQDDLWIFSGNDTGWKDILIHHYIWRWDGNKYSIVSD